MPRSAWSEKRRTSTNRALDAYLSLSIDGPVVECYGRLRARSKTEGWPMTDNDLWIAATAIAHGWPLVTCDRDFGHIEEVEVLYLPSKKDSRPLV